MDSSIIIREIKLKDLAEYENLIRAGREYQKYDGPYYSRMNNDELSNYIAEIKERLLTDKPPLPDKKLIVDQKSDALVGQVNWYWKSEETDWLEIGIVIFNENYWGKGIGYRALPLWINQIFDMFPQIIRIGLSTWSGNIRMIKLAEKLGLKKEAEYRKARIVDGRYYDSLSYGILKEDWYNK